MRGADKEESADKSAERSGANLEGMVTEEEATTAGGVGWKRATQMATAWGTQDIG